MKRLDDMNPVTFTRKIVIGSRGSELALWQADYIKARLLEKKIESEIKIISTKGDRSQQWNTSFEKLEGKGFFTKELEEALLNNEIDLAVHSHKDLPTENPDGLIIAAVSEREDPSELLLIDKNAVELSFPLALKKNAVTGTSSARRKSQLLSIRSDLQIKDLRGNVPTRINKLKNGDYDAIMLAKAGVLRLGIDLNAFYCIALDPKDFVPAPAQGVLALQIRQSDEKLYKLLQLLNNQDVQQQIAIERKVLNLLDGGCQLPLGVYCEITDGNYNVWVSCSESWNKEPIRLQYHNQKAEGLPEKIVADIKNKKH